jgi:ParB-like chromosome segregation protein Spo0J
MHMHLPNEELCLVETLTPYKNNARTHSRKQLRQIADSIERFGFTNPVLVSDDNMIIAGHGRVEAAKLLGMTEVPIRRLLHLSRDEVRAYVLADNKIAENAGWDKDLLAIELLALDELDFDLEVLGFSAAEIDLTIGGALQGTSEPDPVLDKVEPVSDGPAVTQPGGLWLLGPHKLLCGDAR